MLGYEGFRWASQIDPIWNVYLLSIVLSISENIEAARLPVGDDIVFSYRCLWNEENSDIFRKDINWRLFIEKSMSIASTSSHVVICDISEFYPRISHHRLENALLHLKLNNDFHQRIMKILGVFSNTNSYGLPVGGPASRILSELVLSQTDQLMKMKSIKFCRFADDFHIFCDSIEDCYEKILFLTDKLHSNQGLQLQKSKTRIMTAAEFIASNPLKIHDRASAAGGDALAQEKARALLGFSLRFDPYSPDAAQEYEQLKIEVDKFDIMSLLRSEIGKSRIHTSLSRKIVTAVRYISPSQKDGAALSLTENLNLLYPIFSTVMIVLSQIHDELSEDTKEKIQNQVINLINSGSFITKVPVNLSFAVKFLGNKQTYSSEETLSKIYDNTKNNFIRRDIIIIMARWQVWAWLSDKRANFRTMSQPERRAFIIASHFLKDEGKHWRSHISRELSDLELTCSNWVQQRLSQTGWSLPL